MADDAQATTDPTKPMHDDEAVLAAVGPRLRALRTQRRTTSAQLAAVTGASVSTLSRLESGHRRPTRELLLPLARAHQVGVEELLAPPATADPRITTRPTVRWGMTFIPLTRRPDGQQAYKLLVPVRAPALEPQRQVHPGYEWLYVLSGRIRLLLAEHDLTLSCGEVAEFDSRTPTGSATPAPHRPSSSPCSAAPANASTSAPAPPGGDTDLGHWTVLPSQR